MLDFFNWCSFFNTIEYFSKSSNPIFSEQKLLDCAAGSLENSNGDLSLQFSKSIKYAGCIKTG
jgi:hypothetical protein